jgi:tetratricopeptide (TPR) repeat protein
MSPSVIKNEIKVFLDTAQRLFESPALEAQLPDMAREFSSLSLEHLDRLAMEAEKAAISQPRLSWAIAALADAAVSRSDDLILKSKAAWYLARACNEWVRPQRVEEAAGRARAGFAARRETGWVAACEWQRYAVPWTRNDYRMAADKLSEAYQELETGGMIAALPGCRISLAYALILRGEFERSLDLIQISERYYIEKEDRLQYARCLVYRASAYRRKGDLSAARASLLHAQEVFESLDARIDLAKALYQLSIIQHELNNDAQGAIERFGEARETFLAADLPLWVALCDNQASTVHRFVGALGTARNLLHSAREIYARYQVFGSLADNCFDSAQLEIAQGNYAAGMEGFRQAGEYYAKVGAPLAAAHALMQEGYACVQMGAYQKGLALLERAKDRFTVLESTTWQAGCEIDLAEAWIHLHRPDRAMKYLDLAMQQLEQGGGDFLRVHLHKFRARAFMLEDRTDEAVLSLLLAIELAEKRQLRLQEARARLFLGEVYCELHRPDEALDTLYTADRIFTSLENTFGRIATWLFIGEAHFQKGESARAREIWERASSADLDLLPDIAWQVYAGLARLALQQADYPGALRYFHRTSENLVQLRSGFWQPALAGALLQRAGRALDRAVLFAARLNAPEDALRFIEESKAQTISNNLSLKPDIELGFDTPELQTVLSEIRWLHRELQQNNAQESFIYRARQTKLIQQVRMKHADYEVLVSRLERERFGGVADQYDERGDLRARFDLDAFRQLAYEHLGAHWVGVDYYLGENELIGIILTPEDLSIWRSEVRPGLQLALRICDRARGHLTIPGSIDFAHLSESLLPEQVLSNLDPGTTLLIAPHRRSHKIPWAILPAGEDGAPLVNLCTPCIVPSLDYLARLWDRPRSEELGHRSGFVLAVYDFQGRYDPLPLVEDEVARLKSLPGTSLTILEGGEATRAGLSAYVRNRSLDRFSFLHLATHAFEDPLSGYMSGFALYDQDIYLSEIQDLAPLPALVTLSACSGAQSTVYEGDELVGIPIACLAAGAHTVVGSLWPVLDRESPEFMESFYRDLLSGLSPAQALATTQRRMFQQGVPRELWGSYLCFGAP